jgi:predicted HTH domain antitoxin
MSLTLDIPDAILDSMPVPEAERERFLLLEIACSLYARELLSLGKAAELAGIAKTEFGKELGSRGIARHYSEAELAADLAYACGE